MKLRILPRTTALLAALSLAAVAPAQTINLPALGDSVSEDFSTSAEKRLGDQIMREIRRDPDYLDDPLLLQYLQDTFGPLVAQARLLGNIGADTDARYAWEAFLVRDRSVNAFALPGGFIGVHLGLIAMTNNRDELAAVLAHELSHVTQRHIARGMVNQSRQAMLSTAAMILGVLAASRANSTDAANAAIVGGQAAAVQGMLNFSRDMEREADRVGFSVLSGAGYAPAGMASMFERLEAASRLNDNSSYPYLRSHPLTTERLGDARSRVPPGSATPVPSFEHEVVRARARVLMDPRDESLRRAQALDQDAAARGTPQERVLALATSAQASVALREASRAEAAVDAALGLVGKADARAIQALQMVRAQALLVRGDAARATEVLRPYAGDASRPLLLARAQVALAAPDRADALRSAAEDLQTWVSSHPRDALAWATLAQAWGPLKQPLRAVRAEAESYAAIGDLGGAIDRLRSGQRLARGGASGSSEFIEASVIDARLRDLEAQRRALMAEARGEKPAREDTAEPR